MRAREREPEEKGTTNSTPKPLEKMTHNQRDVRKKSICFHFEAHSYRNNQIVIESFVNILQEAGKGSDIYRKSVKWSQNTINHFWHHDIAPILHHVGKHQPSYDCAGLAVEKKV